MFYNFILFEDTIYDRQDLNLIIHCLLYHKKIDIFLVSQGLSFSVSVKKSMVFSTYFCSMLRRSVPVFVLVLFFMNPVQQTQTSHFCYMRKNKDLSNSKWAKLEYTVEKKVSEKEKEKLAGA